MNIHARLVPLFVLSYFVLFGTGCQLGRDVADWVLAPSEEDLSSSPVVVPRLVDFAPTGDLSTAVRQVAQAVRPAVVQITNEQVQEDQFNQPFSFPAGVGSGVTYDLQGRVLTNNHVVEGAQKLLVSLPDGRSFEARVIGADPQTDLAVVQVSGDNLPIATLGDSGQLAVGDWVVAIGNALALPGGPTVNVGVVSALGRTVQEPTDTGRAGPFLFDVIQTSAPINPGNSGGPLVNLAGEVIGINTMVAGQAEPGVQSQGIGFAISIASARPIADQLVKAGRVVHSYFGASYVPLNPAISDHLGIKQIEGVVITRVTSGSPAAQAGLKQGDVVTAVDGKTLQDDSDMAQALYVRQPGDQLKLSILRGAQTVTIPVTLTEMPAH